MNQQITLLLHTVFHHKMLIYIEYINIHQHFKINDEGDSKSPAARRAGSSPAPGTRAKPQVLAICGFFLGHLTA